VVPSLRDRGDPITVLAGADHGLDPNAPEKIAQRKNMRMPETIDDPFIPVVKGIDELCTGKGGAPGFSQ
jgi:hypothetical protein